MVRRRPRAVHDVRGGGGGGSGGVTLLLLSVHDAR